MPALSLVCAFTAMHFSFLYLIPDFFAKISYVSDGYITIFVFNVALRVGSQTNHPMKVFQPFESIQ
jgi:uncharacterized membrane protein YkvA (DUF1232 family)